jgi:hypothetical protein
VYRDECLDIDRPGTRTCFYFVVPPEVPSGVYEVKVIPPTDNRSCDELCATPMPCQGATLFIAPSYTVTLLKQMDINGNSEDDDKAPAEMSFTFTSSSGTPFAVGDEAASLIMLGGTYPGDRWLTHGDHTVAYPHLPLFIGRETLVSSWECEKEISSFPTSSQPREAQQCANRTRENLFTPKFDVAFSGVEFDDSPSKWWGYAAGVGGAALTCYLGSQIGMPCSLSSAGSLVATIANFVNDALQDEDDNLGTSSFRFDNGTWGEFASQLSGPDGDIHIHVENTRTGGLLIKDWKVTLKSITVLEGYDPSEDEPNEVYVHARAFLYQGESQMPPMTRIPAAGNRPVYTGSTLEFDPLEGTLGEGRFNDTGAVVDYGPGENLPPAPESPLIYVEIAVWEYDPDSDDDLMGVYSYTIFLAQVLDDAPYTSKEYTTGGFPVLRFKRTYFGDAHGYAQQGNAEEGRVRIAFDVEVVWLQHTKR